MSKAFDDIVRALDEDDLSVVKGFIINTVRTEFAPLIQSLASEPVQKDESEEVIQVMATGTLASLRAMAKALASEAQG